MSRKPPPNPSNEKQRLTRLRMLRILDTESEPLFDEIIALAQQVCGTSIALISLVDESRQWFKASIGLGEVRETPREFAFCAHAILDTQIMEIGNALADARFKDNPLVTGEPNIRFYAGAPLAMPNGENIGTLCVIDQQAKQLNNEQKELLNRLSRIVVEALLSREKLLNHIDIEETRSTALIESSQDAIITKSLEGFVTSWNEAATKMFGYTEAEMIGRPITQLLPYNKLQEEFYFLNKIYRKEHIRHYETERLTKSGKLINVSVSLSPILDNTGNVIGIAKIARDITQEVELDRQLHAGHEKLRITLDSIGDAVITTDVDGKVEYLNPAAQRICGADITTSIGKPVEEILKIVHEETREPIESPVRVCLRENRIVTLQPHSIMINPSGGECPVEDSSSPIRDKEGKVIGAVMVLFDVTTMRQLSKEMTYRATHDLLTDLYNRKELEVRLQSVLENQLGSNPPSALLYIDLDQFKIVNDTSGHAAGDALLKEISLILQKSVRKNDFIARMGGDEFAMILENAGMDRAMQIANTICKNVDHHRFFYQGKKFRVGCSIGVAMINNEWKNVVDLMQAADNACYAAKEAGRNQVRLFIEKDSQVATHRGDLKWVDLVQHAMEDNRILLYGQRIVPMNASENEHIEILIRMLDENDDIVLPGAFLPAIERFHLSQRLDRWVVKKTFDWIAQNKTRLAHIDSISINLSGQSLGDYHFHQYVQELINTTSIDFNRICFEITETAAITNIIAANKFIESMKNNGIKFALDDFGSGVSSFGYLQSLPVDYLKIDGQFIQDLSQNRVGQATVKCIHEIASITGKKTIAEWVSEKEVESMLRAIGVNYAQGSLMHMPMPIDTLIP